MTAERDPASPRAGEPASPDALTREVVAIAEQVLRAATAASITVSAAESCTGGLVGHVLTEVPGSSDYFLGSAVCYSDDAKRALLDVPEGALEHHGAVSAQVAVAMAEGARRRFGSTLAVAVTGIAGPSGGTAAKPIGLTYVAVADEGGHDVRRYTWPGDRTRNKLDSARAALELVLERLAAG